MKFLRRGFCKFVQVILRLVPLGVVVAGPPCSSFVWVNKSTSKRSRGRPLGDSSKQYVRESNTTFASTFISLLWFLVGRDAECTQKLFDWHTYFEPRINARLSMLCLLASCRQAYVAIEQPSSSVMPFLLYWIHVAKSVKPLTWFATRLS